MNQEEAIARYFSPMKPKQALESYRALRREMEVHKFMERTGLSRDEVTIVVNQRTGKAFCQWIHAVPKAVEVRNV